MTTFHYVGGASAGATADDHFNVVGASVLIGIGAGAGAIGAIVVLANLVVIYLLCALVVCNCGGAAGDAIARVCGVVDVVSACAGVALKRMGETAGCRIFVSEFP